VIKDSGRLEVMSIVSITFVDEGKSLAFELIDCALPECSSVLTCVNAWSISLHYDNTDGYPMTVIDLTWAPVLHDAKASVLNRLHFPFYDASRQRLTPPGELVVVHLEGGVYGDILAEHVDVL
jgi:hypothetical protein